MSKSKKILCPKCGTEYLLAEIYYPKSFVGNPHNIIKDETGKILGFDNSDSNLTEEFICDKCDSKFQVTASITFETKLVNDIFDEDDNF